MYVSRLRLENFRNYDYADLSFSQNMNVIYGNNAQGKTNLLEALYLSSHAKSFKNVPIYEMIRKSEKKAQVDLSFFSFGRHQELRIIFERENKRKIFLNDVEIKSPSRLLQHFKVVFFSPDDLLLVKKGPELRRKFLDQLISQVSPSYLSALITYQKILEQKNKLLKMMKEDTQGEDTLSIWNERLAEFMAYLMIKRNEYLNKLQTKSDDFHLQMTGQPLYIRYLPSISSFFPQQQDLLKEQIVKFLEEKKESEKRAGASLFGTHRDDFDLSIEDMSARHFASQGQQRSVALCLKMAQSEVIRDEFSEYPLILLDDILSELDQKRRAFLLSHLTGKQIMITCTDKEIYKSDQIRYFYVEGGKILMEK